MGYGTLIMGIRDSKKLRELFNIPENEEVVAVIAVGKAEVLPTAPKKKRIVRSCKIF